ncbi:phage head-tail adapter protein, partial [Escherichia coli]|nr:phage head-tail adapter protein [Escherichia coli]
MRTELTDSNYKHKHLYYLTMKKYYLLSLVTASLIGATCIQC